MVRKAVSSLLVSGLPRQFSHRMNIRCFLTGLSGQEDKPSDDCDALKSGCRSILKLPQPPFLLYRKLLKSAKMVYNKLEIKKA